MTPQIIGFIGLGLLGTGFVKRLVSLGHTVVGFDIVTEKVDAASKFGVEPAASPAAVAARADIVLLCVTSTDSVKAVIEGEAGIATAGPLHGKILVDHSTTDIEVTKALASRLADRTGMTMIDAPVSGGPGAAEAGTLAIMAGGPDAAINHVRPIMEQLGRFTHMGEIGAGQATKLVNQAVVLTNYCVMAEAVRLAQAYGVDALKVPQALATGHAGSNLMPVMFERMVSENFEPLGYARQVLKDLEMLSLAAKDKHLAMPMASQALTMFRLLISQGKSELDGSAVVTLFPLSR